jgi:hypothetical protein
MPERASLLSDPADTVPRRENLRIGTAFIPVGDPDRNALLVTDR